MIRLLLVARRADKLQATMRHVSRENGMTGLDETVLPASDGTSTLTATARQVRFGGALSYYIEQQMVRMKVDHAYNGYRRYIMSSAVAGKWAQVLVEELGAMHGEILENQKRVLERLQEITERLKTLDAKIDEQTLRGALTGIQHLLDALNSDVERIRSDKFMLAGSEFTRLTMLAPEGKTAGTSGEIENKYLICLGYWGNFHYFNLQGDKRNAAIQIYECTKKYPLIGLILFSPKSFSRDYASIIGSIVGQLAEIQTRLHEAEWSNFWKGLWYYTKQGARLTAIGFSALGAAAIAGALSGGTGAPYGVVVARSLEQSLKVEGAQYKDVESLRKKADALGQELLQQLTELRTECETRQAALNKLSLEDLLRSAQSASHV